MKRNYIILLVLLLMSTLSARAQNSIDRLMDNFSTVGNAKYSSVVQRNPNTRAVVRTIRTLTLHGQSIKPIKKAFEDEADTGDTYTTVNDGQTTMVLIVQKNRKQYMYTLKYRSNMALSGGKVSIITTNNHQ